MDINTLNISNVNLHHKKRRILNLIFNDKLIKAARLCIHGHIDRWNEILLDGYGNE